MAEKKITVKIAKRTYPLTIDSAEESKVLGAVQLINDNINKLKWIVWWTVNDSPAAVFEKNP